MSEQVRAAPGPRPRWNALAHYLLPVSALLCVLCVSAVSLGGIPMSPSEERVRAALSFRQPDRVPRFDSFWPEFEAVWRQDKQLGEEVRPDDYYGIDLAVAVADETPWPTRARILSDDGHERLNVDGWGRTIRTRVDAMFSETMEVAVDEPASLDSLAFDPPSLPERYAGFLATVQAEKPKRAVFAKTGGPFLRTSFVRGEADYLMDLAADERFASEMTAKVNEHIPRSASSRASRRRAAFGHLDLR